MANTSDNSKDLELREKRVNEKEAELVKREQEVSNLEEIKNDLERRYQDKNNQLSRELESILNEKNKFVAEKTVELNKLQNNIEEEKVSLSNIKKDVITAQLNKDTEIEKYTNEKKLQVENALIQKIKEEMNSIEQGHKEKVDSLLNEIRWNKDLLDSSFNTMLEEHRKSIEDEKKLIQGKIDDLNGTKELYDNEFEKYSDFETKKTELELKERNLERKSKGLDSLIEKQVERKYSEIINEVSSLKKQKEELVNKFTELSGKYDELLNSASNVENLNKNELIENNKNLKLQLIDYSKKIGNQTTDEYEELKSKAQKYDDAKENERALTNKNIELDHKITQLKNELMTINGLQSYKETLEQQVRANRLLLTNLTEDINKLTDRMDGKKVSMTAAKDIETPLPEFEHTKDVISSIDEIDWLNNIIAKCKESGYTFSKRLFYSFHTCLKTSDMSPLTVLAGVSGTGKSKLPQLYSRFGGLYFLSEPVKPDWDSPQSLFGYFNSIEKRFNATSLLRAIVPFQLDKSKSVNKDNLQSYSDRVILVLLDEMNLAHVELYFSDLLSKLEERRGETKDISFELDMGTDIEKYKVYLTDNVKWIGTMNEDETTKSLSDKVIDRGNVISFPRPDRFERYHINNLAEESKKLDRKLWDDWNASKVSLNNEELDYYMEIVIKINNEMKKVNRALGHRVWQSIENYMISHPLVKKYENDKDKRGLALKYAFEEALVQKVMTKLRGLDTDGLQKECLENISSILIDSKLTSISGDFANAMNSITGNFVWESANYLEQDYDGLE